MSQDLRHPHFHYEIIERLRESQTKLFLSISPLLFHRIHRCLKIQGTPIFNRFFKFDEILLIQVARSCNNSTIAIYKFEDLVLWFSIYSVLWIRLKDQLKNFHRNILKLTSIKTSSNPEVRLPLRLVKIGKGPFINYVTQF